MLEKLRKILGWSDLKANEFIAVFFFFQVYRFLLNIFLNIYFNSAVAYSVALGLFMAGNKEVSSNIPVEKVYKLLFIWHYTVFYIYVICLDNVMSLRNIF